MRTSHGYDHAGFWETTTMKDIFKDGTFIPDKWTYLGEKDELPESGWVFVTLQRLKTEFEKIKKFNVPVGVVIQAGERPEDLVGKLGNLEAIAVEFPKFSDGRSYSTARKCSEEFQFKGEIRAIGDVLLDQIPFMRRCGITVFEITDDATRRALADDKNPEILLHTQPVGLTSESRIGSRPWLRKGIGISTLS